MFRHLLHFVRTCHHIYQTQFKHDMGNIRHNISDTISDISDTIEMIMMLLLLLLMLMNIEHVTMFKMMTML